MTTDLELENKAEEVLEQLYWEFDTQIKEGKRSERDIFKGKVRWFANYVLDKYLDKYG